jgi:hypothetical protein
MRERPKLILAAVIVSLSFGFGACSSDDAEREAGETAKEAEKAGKDAADKAEDAANDAQDAAEDATGGS